MSGSEEQAPGRVVAGRYRIESVLGRGGMGVVWRAVDTLIERTVALKELRAPAGDESSFVERALREARNAGRLNHPAIVAIYDVIAPTGDDDAVYIVMEHVQAPSFAEVIDQYGPLPPARAAEMGLGILDALEAAHAMGIVHRDIKPGNVLVREGDRVKLTDFGIALAAEDSRLTRSGVMGTHAYLAPECFDAAEVGPAADLWALGATLFHAVVGRAPFERDTTTATLRAILFEDPPAPPCGPPLDEAIAGLLTRPVDRRLTSGAARQLLQQAANTMPTVEAPPTVGAGRAPWQAQATTHHHRPTPPGPQTTHPGGPPSPYVTAQHPPPMRLSTGPAYGPGPGGAPPPRRNKTPLILGVVGAVAVVVLLQRFMVLAATDGDGDATTDVTLPSGATVEVPGDEGRVSPDSGGGTSAEAVAQEFLDGVSSGDEVTATGTLCADSDSASAISDAIAGDASLYPDSSTVDSSDNGYQAELLGTVDGEPITHGSINVYPMDDDEGWCVFTFYFL